MKILSIETSCDETAVSIVEATGGLEKPSFVALGNALFSQIDLHKEYGGVFPMLAKREHAKNLPHILTETLTQAGEIKKSDTTYTEETWEKIQEVLAKEDGLYEGLRNALEHIARPELDVIAVTEGPGLEPALWVGISCAKALGILWNIPVIGVNHMEGHITSVLFYKTDEALNPKSEIRNKNSKIQFPALALLISGGHTELVKIENWGQYEVIGQTLDDAVGEAFDKAARMMSLPYPGGPQISKLAESARGENLPHITKLPRPMIHSKNLDFSFSGLKTAVLYYIRDNPLTSEMQKKDVAREFEDAVVDVLLQKTKQALDETGAQTLIVAGGVIANKKLRETFAALEGEYGGIVVKTPSRDLATDNALMIAAAGYIRTLTNPTLLTNPQPNIVAQGNLKLGK